MMNQARIDDHLEDRLSPCCDSARLPARNASWGGDGATDPSRHEPPTPSPPWGSAGGVSNLCDPLRLWTLHPSYLDARGLIAVWREALLAQKVLAGGTRGYRNNPQLIRFRATEDPAASIAAYLLAIADEGRHRGYALDVRRILTEPLWAPVLATTGQL